MISGLFGPDSVTWRLHAEPILWFAGYRALLLQSLHPRALAGVLQNSNFREDPWGRLIRTARFYGEVIYGDSATAAQAGARVRRIHARLGGTDPDTGAAFRVDEPDLLRWIYVTATESFCSTAQRAGLGLTPAEVDRYYDEQRAVAELVGLDRDDVPVDAAGIEAYYESMRPMLRAGADAHATARFLAVPTMPVGAGLDAGPATVARRLGVRVQPAADLGAPHVRLAGAADDRPGRDADQSHDPVGHPCAAHRARWRDRSTRPRWPRGPGPVDHPERRRQRHDQQDQDGRDGEGQTQAARVEVAGVVHVPAKTPMITDPTMTPA